MYFFRKLCRILLLLLTLLCMTGKNNRMGIMLLFAAATGKEKLGDIVSVLDFGAKGDGVTDNTEAFQSALDYVKNKHGGGKVYVPKGKYLIKGHLNIPDNVTLEGIWEMPPRTTSYEGSVLLAVEGEGKPDGTPFITLNTNSAIKGIIILYPNQVWSDSPKPYPWTIASGGGDNSSIIDVLLVNPYQAVDFGTKPSGRHYIRNLYGHPLYKGLYINQCYDVGRVENVHFWTFWGWEGAGTGIGKFTTHNGTAFIIGRTDWEYMYNTFCFGYKVGYHFVRTEQGSANGNFLGIGADATNIAVLVDDCELFGLLITNGEFVSFIDPEPTTVVVGPNNKGNIQFQNCSFWGHALERIAVIKGNGTVAFNNCNFMQYDSKNKWIPAIECMEGNLIINSCSFTDFGFRKFHILLHPKVKTAVITSNRFSGLPVIENNSEGDVQIGLNAAGMKAPIEEPEAIIIDDLDKEPLFYTEGEWYRGSGGPGANDYLGLVVWALKGNGECKAYWRPNLPSDGKYKVYIWYGGDPARDHATDAPYTVAHKNGSKTFKVDLTKNWGQWNLLGEFEFEKGDKGYVMVTNKANGNVLADAVKFIKVK